MNHAVIACVAMLVMSAPARSADKALILNDQEQAALRNVLDIATKAEGLKIAPATVYLMNKLDAAGVVTERKDPTPEPKKDPPQ
jgi:hypothetical protein